MNFIKKNWLWMVIIVGLGIALVMQDSCKNRKFASQKAELVDSLTQNFIVKENKLKQEVAMKEAVVVSTQKEIKEKTAEIFQLKDKDQKQIRRIDALLRVSSKVVIGKSIQVPYLDSLAMLKFSDSVRRECKEVIDAYEAVLKWERPVAYKDSDIAVYGKTNDKGFLLDSLDLPNTVNISINELKGGLLKKDITGKRKFWLPKKLVINAMNTNKYLQINGLSSTIYQAPINGRWLERFILIGTGIFIGTQLKL